MRGFGASARNPIRSVVPTSVSALLSRARDCLRKSTSACASFASCSSDTALQYVLDFGHLLRIGCICALVKEAVALRTFVDEEHEFPEHDDDNNYAAGLIRAHKVVIATLPFRGYGIAEAAGVIRDMVRTFPNLRCCLMVEIGGGAPMPDIPNHDVRLGDVVVGAPVNNSRSGGVLQWAHGKFVQDQEFRSTQHLDGPPRFLLCATHKLIQTHQLRGSPLRKMVDEVFVKSPYPVELGYQRPEDDCH
jgi:hypothetical protein